MAPADIENRADIELCMRTFYERLLSDPEFHHLFIEIVGINLEDHLPIICDFWEGVLFNTNRYRRNTLQKHLDLHKQYPLEKRHFDKWLSVFAETIDELYLGDKARLAKERALSIATVIQMKLVS